MKPTRKPLFPTSSICYQGTRPLALAFAAVLTLGCQSAFAALTWNSAGPSDLWSTAGANTNWNPGGVVWTQNESAVFDGTSGTPEAINVTTANTFNDITFDVTSFSISSAGAGSLLLANDLASTITVTTAGHTASIAETIADNAGGASTLTKAGLGTLTLNGTANNTYSGGTTVSAGTLSSSQNTNIALLGTGAVSIAPSATLNLTNTSTTTVDTTVSNTVSGSGAITTTSGTRALNIQGDLSGFTGNLTIGSTGAGKIAVNPSVAIPSGASVTIPSGGTFFSSGKTFTNNFTAAGTGNTENRGAFRLDSGCLISGNIALTADTSIGNSGASASTISGVISGTGFGIRGAITGNQPIILSGPNTFTGKATVVGGNVFSVSAINNSGSVGNLGTNATIDFGTTTTGGTLVYTGAGEITDRVINLAGTTGGGTVTQSATSGPLKITGNLTATGLGIKTLTLNGSTAGTGEISGVIIDNSGTNKTSVAKNGTGIWTLSGNNSYTGTTTVTAGTLIVAAATSTTGAYSVGPGTLVAGNTSAFGALATSVGISTTNANGSGILDLATDTSIGAYVITASSSNPGTIISNKATPGTAGITHALGSTGLGNNIFSFEAGANVTSGSPGISLASVNLSAGGAGTMTLNPTSASLVIPGVVNIGLNNFAKTLALSGTNANNAISGVISNGLNTLSVAKSNTSTWILSGNNTYTGSTTVSGGTLVMSGTNATTGTTAVNGGSLKLDYTVNDTTKLPDAAVLTLGGGTLEISGGTHSEKVLSTTLTASKLSNITRTNSATGALKLGTVTANPGSQVVFGTDNIASTTSANINGILPWARVLVGGVPTLGINSGVSDGDTGFLISSYGSYTDVNRLGGTIPNAVTNNLRIVEAGVSGDITLAESPLTACNFLEMSATGGPALINPGTSDILMIGDEGGGNVWQSATAGALTIGATANDGILTSGNTENGAATLLTFINDNTTNPITVNSVIANNGVTTPDVISLGKGGAGQLVLAGNNTFTGGVTAAAGSLILSGNNSFTGTLAVSNAGTTVTLSGNNSGRPAATTNLTTVTNGAILQLQANEGNTSSGLSYALSGEQTANSPLGLSGGSQLQLRADAPVTFAGTNNIGALNNTTVGIDVDRLGASASNNTLTAAASLLPIGNAVTVNVTGANGYSLALGTFRSVTGSATNLTLNPTTANLSIGGYHNWYNPAKADSSTLTLSGTTTGNTVSGVIADQGTGSIGTGKAALTKSGSGKWTLNGVNTFTGNTTINAGSLAIGGSGSLGTGAYAGTIANAGTLDYASSATQSLDGIISGAGTLASSGTGSLRLTAANTYTGPTTITSGTVIAQNNAALGTAAAGTTVSSGGTLDLSGTMAANGLNLATEILTISGTGVGGNGVLVNNGSNDQSNATGRIVLAGNATLGGTKRWDLRSSTPTLDMGGFTITKTGVNYIPLVGVNVSNPGHVIVNQGTFAVETTTNLGGSSANTFTVNTGSGLNFYGNTNPVAWSIALNDASLNQTNTNTTLNGPITLSGANTISVSGTSLTINSVVGGTGGFTKTGANLLTVNGNNDYDGTTTVNAGRLALGHNSALADTTAATTVANGAQLELNNGVTITGESATISGSGMAAGTGAFRGALQAGSAATATWAGNLILDLADTRIGTQPNGTLTVTGVIDDGANTFDLDISADATNGVVVLSGANTYGGATELIRGTLRLGATNTLPTGSLLDVDAATGVADAVILDLASYSQTVSGIQDTATTNVNGVITNSVAATNSVLSINGSANTTYDGVIQDGAGAVSLTKDGGGIQTLNGANSYTGVTSILGGTLRINGNQSLATGAVSVSNGGTLGGTGTLGAAVAIASGGTVAPGNSTGVLLTNSADFAPGAKLAIEINEASTPKVDMLDVIGALDITGATLEISATGALAETVHVIATYSSLTGTFTNIAGMPLKYKIDYNYAGGTQIALVPSNFGTWASFKGLTAGVNDGPDQDPDNDGQTNLAEFSFDGNPLSGANDGKIVGKIASVGGQNVLTLTLPVRTGASFTGATEQVSALIDGIVYRVQGSDELVAPWNLAITEVTGLDATNIQTGMPGLSVVPGDTGSWSYRTFRTPGHVADGDPRDFLRAGAQ